MSDHELIEIDLGKSSGLNHGSTISHDALKKIMFGMEKGDKEKIYFYGLLKLYGNSVSKNVTVAAQNFERAARLGHVEAATAFGMMNYHGIGIAQDLAMALSMFRKGVELRDINAPWLLAKYVPYCIVLCRIVSKIKQKQTTYVFHSYIYSFNLACLALSPNPKSLLLLHILLPLFFLSFLYIIYIYIYNIYIYIYPTL